MEDLGTAGLTEEQLQICQERLDGRTYDEILANHPTIDSHMRLRFCLQRTVMGYQVRQHAKIATSLLHTLFVFRANHASTDAASNANGTI
jgi:hypothetical protein